VHTHQLVYIYGHQLLSSTSRLLTD